MIQLHPQIIILCLKNFYHKLIIVESYVFALKTLREYQIKFVKILVL